MAYKLASLRLIVTDQEDKFRPDIICSFFKPNSIFLTSKKNLIYPEKRIYGLIDDQSSVIIISAPAGFGKLKIISKSIVIFP